MQVFRLPGERSSPTGLKTNNPPCDEVVCGLGDLQITKMLGSRVHMRLLEM